MGCQKARAQTIMAQDADDGLALTDNHPTLYENVALFMQDAKAHNGGPGTYQCEETVDADHGRLEIRTDWITSDLEWLGAKGSGPNLHRVGLGESRREVADQVTVATRYY